MNKFPVINVSALLVMAGSLIFSTSPFVAQGRSDSAEIPTARKGQITPFSEATQVERYEFPMRLPVNTDVRVAVRKLQSAPAEGSPQKPQSDTDIQQEQIVRRIRAQLVEEQRTDPDGLVKTRYFFKGWCAFDDPRKGINVVRTGLDRGNDPLDRYHFPELLWAWPETRTLGDDSASQPTPLPTYKDSNRILEINAETGYPNRFSDGTREYIYSYSQSNQAIRLPPQLEEAARKTSKTTGGQP